MKYLSKETQDRVEQIRRDWFGVGDSGVGDIRFLLDLVKHMDQRINTQMHNFKTLLEIHTKLRQQHRTEAEYLRDETRRRIQENNQLLEDNMRLNEERERLRKPALRLRVAEMRLTIASEAFTDAVGADPDSPLGLELQDAAAEVDGARNEIAEVVMAMEFPDGSKCQCCKEHPAVGWQAGTTGELVKVCDLCKAPGAPLIGL